MIAKNNSQWYFEFVKCKTIFLPTGLKLNERLAAPGLAINPLVDVGNLMEEELTVIQKYYRMPGFVADKVENF